MHFKRVTTYYNLIFNNLHSFSLNCSSLFNDGDDRVNENDPCANSNEDDAIFNRNDEFIGSNGYDYDRVHSRVNGASAHDCNHASLNLDKLLN